MSFYCEKLSATLSESLCEQRFNRKNFLICSDCEIGASRVGQTIPLNLNLVCSRCQKSSLPLVRKRLCKSCYNREGESKRGFDRRHKPVKKIPLLAVACEKGIFSETAKSFLEVLIDCVKQKIDTVYSFVHPSYGFMQYDLFTIFA